MSERFDREALEANWEITSEFGESTQEVTDSVSEKVQTGYGPIFLLLLLLAVIASIVAGLVVHSIGNEKVHIYYRVIVARSCLQLDAQYQDVKLGKAVTVFNKANGLLGTGRLEVQVASQGKCEYAALFTVKRSNDRTYKIGTGADYRGKLIFTDSDLVTLRQGRTLVVVASLE